MMAFARVTAVSLLGLVTYGVHGSLAQFGSGQPERLIFEANLKAGALFPSRDCPIADGDGGVILTHAGARGSCRQSLGGHLIFTPAFRIDATVRWRKGPENEHFGIYFADRFERESYLTLTITNTGAVALESWDGKKWQRFAGQTPAPRPLPGALNRLAVEVREKEVRAFLNGALVAVGPSPAPLDGEAGLYVDEPGQEVLITEFKVTALGSAGAPPVTPPTVTPNPPSTSTSMTAGGTIFLEDDLSTLHNYQVVASDTCTSAYKDGGLSVQTPAGCEWTPGDLAERPIRARFEVSVRLLKAETAGLVFGKSSRTDNLHYHFEIGDAGDFVLELVQNGKATPLIAWRAAQPIRTAAGATNRLGIEVLGQELRCFINGQLVGQATSPNVVQGGWGILVRGNAVAAVFSNLKITDLSTANTGVRETAGAPPIARGPSTGRALAAVEPAVAHPRPRPGKSPER